MRFGSERLKVLIATVVVRAHSGHITSRSARKRWEPPRSQPHVKPHAWCVRHGQRDACTGPGLQAGSPLIHWS